MKLKNPMLVVTDIDKSVEFYKKVFGLHVIMDFGANKTLTGGLALQTVETYKDFIGKSDISFGGNNFEIYFEEDNFDEFADKLKECDVEYGKENKYDDDIFFQKYSQMSRSQQGQAGVAPC